jgi:hypothetical protein
MFYQKTCARTRHEPRLRLIRLLTKRFVLECLRDFGIMDRLYFRPL